MKPLRTTLYVAVALFILDAFVLNQGFVALCLVLVSLFVFLPRTLWVRRRDRHLYQQRLAKAGIYLLVAFSVFGANALQNRMADRRAITVGNACLAFHAKYQHYPRRLEELVPEFLPSVPVAKYTLGGHDSFFYFSPPSGGSPCSSIRPYLPLGVAFTTWKKGDGDTSIEVGSLRTHHASSRRLRD